MGLFSSLFGSNKPVKTTAEQNYLPEDLAAHKQVTQAATNLYNTQAATNTPYMGATPVGPSAATTAGQETTMGNAATLQNTYLPEMQNATNYGLTTAMDVNNNPYLKESVDAANKATVQAATDPNGAFAAIRSGAGMNGNYGASTRTGIAEGIANSRLNDTLAKQSADMYSHGYDVGQQTFNNTLGLTPSLMKTYSMPGEMQSAVGNQQEGYLAANNAYDAAAREWNYNQPTQELQNFANIINPGILSTGSSTSTSGNKPNGFMQALGAAGTIASIFK